MSNKQIITLYDQYVELTIEGITKLISIEDFKNIFDKVLMSDVKIEPLVLPRNVLMFGKGSNNVQINTYWPSIDATLKHRRDSGTKPKEFKVKMPNVIIYYYLSMNNIGTYSVNTCRYFSTPKTPGELGLCNNNANEFIKEVDFNKGIYNLALPNMYSDGKACYGQNSMPNGFKNDFRGLDWYYLFLKETPFNSDLSVQGVKRDYGSALNLLTFLEEENKKPNYVYDFKKLYGVK